MGQSDHTKNRHAGCSKISRLSQNDKKATFVAFFVLENDQFFCCFTNYQSVFYPL